MCCNLLQGCVSALVASELKQFDTILAELLWAGADLECVSNEVGILPYIA